MKVLFDYQIFTLQRYGGVSKYFAEIIRRMPEGSWILNPRFSENEYLRFYDIIDQHPFPVKKDFYGKSRIMNEICKLNGIRDVRSGNFDVFHQTDYDPYALRHLKGKPFITTFHDANYLNGNNPRPRFVPFLKRSLEEASSIITISQNSKKDLLYYFPSVDPAKIKVIYHGIDSPGTLKPERVVDGEYILYVGGRNSYKNFGVFSEAISLVAPKYRGLKVICTMSPFTASETEMFERLGISSVMEYKCVNEEELNRLYRDALMFVYPSLYEGFGMPILESMVNGCPLVLSDASCFPEIAGDAALYCDPGSAEDFADKISSLLDSGTLRRQLVGKGMLRVKDFSWEKTVREHIDLYSQYS